MGTQPRKAVIPQREQSLRWWVMVSMMLRRSLWQTWVSQLAQALTLLLTLIDLSRIVFRRVYFNFGWALVYNMIALPIAAGVLYPVVSNGSHFRLAPVWASVAMALSSVSVVCSSLLMRSRLPGVGFRAVNFPEEREKQAVTMEV